MIINWRNSEEYIEIEFDSLHKCNEITTTFEFWPETSEWVQYNTSSSIKKLNDDIYQLKIKYDANKNTHLNQDDIAWGESVITIEPKKLSGIAIWKDAENQKQNRKSRWKKISNALIGEKKKINSSIRQRNQNKFRGALLALDKRCVLTGEETEEALEAAHIIPVKNNGTEIISNGILLRADLHRLYDSDLFAIDKTGKVIVNGHISEAYKKILNNAELPKIVFMRIRGALYYVSENLTK